MWCLGLRLCVSFNLTGTLCTIVFISLILQTKQSRLRVWTFPWPWSKWQPSFQVWLQASFSFRYFLGQQCSNLSPLTWHIEMSGWKPLIMVEMSDSVSPWTVTCQAPLSMGFSRQEYRSGLSFPSPGHLPALGIELVFPAWQANSLLLCKLRACLLSPVWLFASPWTVASPPGSCAHGIFKNTGVGCHFRKSSQSRDQTLVSYVSCIGRWIFHQ